MSEFKVLSTFCKLDNSSVKRKLANCKCNCGKTFVCRYDDLKNRKGCRKCGNSYGGKRRIYPDYQAAISAFYRAYKRNSKDRELDFSLSLEEFSNFISLKCYYCNDPPKDANYLSKSTRKYKGFLANGIDRVDNTKGYIKENCVTCCTTCNMMKKTLTIDKFLEQISKIYKYKLNE